MEPVKLSGELRHIVNHSSYSRGSTRVTETTHRGYEQLFDRPAGLKQLQTVVCPECRQNVDVLVHSALRNSITQAPLWLLMAALLSVAGAALMIVDAISGIHWFGFAIWFVAAVCVAGLVCTLIRGAAPSVKVSGTGEGSHAVAMELPKFTLPGRILFFGALAGWRWDTWCSATQPNSASVCESTPGRRFQ
ncbi:MAG: hypothetical protein ACT4QC_21440 [Planctomycetaceae bacterium]